MRRMQKNPAAERGMTTLGLLILLTFLGIFAYGAMRLLPVYLEDLKIANTFKKLEQEFGSGGATKVVIQKSIQNSFIADSVGIIDAKDIKVRKTSEGYDVNVSYTHKTPFLFNIYFAVDFSHRASLQR